MDGRIFCSHKHAIGEIDKGELVIRHRRRVVRIHPAATEGNIVVIQCDKCGEKVEIFLNRRQDSE